MFDRLVIITGGIDLPPVKSKHGSTVRKDHLANTRVFYFVVPAKALSRLVLELNLMFAITSRCWYRL